MSWNKEIKDYTYYIKLEKKLSQNSVDAYLSDLERIAEYMQAQYGIVRPEKVKAEHIDAFLANLYELGMQPATQARVLSGVKSFFNYLLVNDRIDRLPTEFTDPPKIGRKLPSFLTFEQVGQVLDAIDLSKPFGHRNRAIIESLYSCGLRVTEAITLKIGDLFFDDGFIRVIGKGDKQRLVPVSDELVKQVNIYLDQRRSMKVSPRHADNLFLNNKGEPLTRVMIFHIIRQAAEAAGITKSISPHTFRHSFATHLFEGGASIRQVQELLGHESILTTEIYTHLDRTQLRESVEQHHPMVHHSIREHTEE